MAQFVHLHVHTQYSILDGASDIGRLLKRGKALGMPAMAITDHGNMFGAKEFHDKAVKEGIKPILGCEVYVVKNRFERDKDEKAGDHLILLAKNMEGYHNLIRMVSYGWTEGFYYKPRIDKSLLRDYHEGIICCSACLGGEVPQAIMRNDIAGAEEIVREFRGRVEAGVWQVVAKIFGHNLKTEYDPEGEDAMIEQIVKYIEAGAWQLVAKIFGHNLKTEYDPEGEDAMIEQIVKYIEAGEL